MFRQKRFILCIGILNILITDRDILAVNDTVTTKEYH